MTGSIKDILLEKVSGLPLKRVVTIPVKGWRQNSCRGQSAYSHVANANIKRDCLSVSSRSCRYNRGIVSVSLIAADSIVTFPIGVSHRRQGRISRTSARASPLLRRGRSTPRDSPSRPLTARTASSILGHFGPPAYMQLISSLMYHTHGRAINKHVEAERRQPHAREWAILGKPSVSTTKTSRPPLQHNPIPMLTGTLRLGSRHDVVSMDRWRA